MRRLSAPSFRQGNSSGPPLRCRDLRGRDALEREPVRQALLKAAAEASRKRHPRIPQSERILRLEMSSQFPGPRQKSLARQHLVDGAILFCFRRAQLLAAEQKVPATNLPDDFWPHDVQAVTRHNAKRRMRCILEVRTFSRKDDVAEERVFGMHGHRS